MDSGDVQVSPDDPQKLSVGLAALAPGSYTVKYRVLSVDGHIVENQFPFEVPMELSTSPYWSMVADGAVEAAITYTLFRRCDRRTAGDRCSPLAQGFSRESA